LQTSKFSKIHAYLSFIVAGVFVLVLLTWWVIFEYIVIIAISIWVAVISLHTLYNDN
ncbi:unnamed protein product, partial [marine sediment metagenome]